jgi:hypothetical protein
VQRKLVLVVVDAMHPDMLLRAIDEEEAPTFAALLERGHRVSLDGPWSHGQVTVVAREPNGVLSGAASPRGRVAYVMGR